MTPDTINIHYYATDRHAYWIVDDGDAPATFCANRYASFKGDELGQNQVMGAARTPLSVKNVRDYMISEYRQWNGYSAKVSFKRVRDIKDLWSVRDKVKQTERWFAFTAWNSQSHTGFGTEQEADKYADILNRKREVNQYHYKALDLSEDEEPGDGFRLDLAIENQAEMDEDMS